MDLLNLELAIHGTCGFKGYTVVFTDLLEAFKTNRGKFVAETLRIPNGVEFKGTKHVSKWAYKVKEICPLDILFYI